MKKIFGVALLALPLTIGSVHAAGFPFNVQASGSFQIKGARGPTSPQAGPWYLYWPLEAHFVAPAPTGYPYWPSPQGLPGMNIGGPAGPPPQVYAPPSAPTMQAPSSPAPQGTPPAGPKLQFPPYLQPTSYYPLAAGGQPASYNPIVYSGQPPSYWYDR